MRLKVNVGVLVKRAPDLICALLTGTALFAHSGPVFAKPLDRDACAALQKEHETLVDPNMAADLKKGADWAKDNLGQLRLQKIARLFVVEERLAFGCRGFAVADAIVIPSLRTAVTAPALSAARGRARGARVSNVPPPVRRPARVQGANLGTAQPPTRKQNLEAAPAPPNAKKTKVNTATKPAVTAVTNSAPSPDQPGAQTASELPKVIRLQEGRGTAASGANAKPKRRAVKRVRKPRRKRTKQRDSYVPPPPNPGYQPSLSAP